MYTFKVLAKDHHVVHSWVADEILVLKILFRKHKKHAPIILSYY